MATMTASVNNAGRGARPSATAVRRMAYSESPVRVETREDKKMLRAKKFGVGGQAFVILDP
jgi:hypothetical protein